MTRTTIGGITAGAFTLGILAGLVFPGMLGAARHDQLMATHLSAMAAMPMMDIGAMSMDVGSMPMMGTGSMPSMDMGSIGAGHEAHHASPEAGQ